MPSDEVGLIGLDTVGAVGVAMITNLAKAGVSVWSPHDPRPAAVEAAGPSRA